LPTPELAFAPATPDSVRHYLQQLASWLSTPRSGRLRKAVARLAGDEAMASLWRKLPARLRGHEVEMIEQALSAYERAIRLRPPIDQHYRELEEFLRKHQPAMDPETRAEYLERFVDPPTYSGIWVAASSLLDQLKEVLPYEQAPLAEVLACDPSITVDKLLSIVEAVSAWGWRLSNEAEARRAEAPANLPKPRGRPGGATAKQVWFDRLLQDYFRREFGQPMTRIIADLEEVLFELPNAVSEDTVRKRR
jgi:hypothetical protein